MNDDIYRPYYINQVDDYVGGLGTSQLQLTIEGLQEQIYKIETTLGTTTDSGTENESNLITRIEEIETTTEDHTQQHETHTTNINNIDQVLSALEAFEAGNYEQAALDLTNYFTTVNSHTQQHETHTTNINNINQVLSALEAFSSGNYEQAALDLTNFFTTVNDHSDQHIQHVTDIEALKESDNQFTLTIQGLADQVTGHQTDISGILDTNATTDQRFTDVAADLLDLQGQIDFINNSTAVLFVAQVLYEILKWKFGATINALAKKVWDRMNGRYKEDYDAVASGDTYNTFTGDSIQAILEELNDMASVYRYDSLNNAAGINADPISTYGTTIYKSLLLYGLSDANIYLTGDIKFGSFNTTTDLFTTTKSLSDYLVIKGVKANHCLKINSTDDLLYLDFTDDFEEEATTHKLKLALSSIIKKNATNDAIGIGTDPIATYICVIGGKTKVQGILEIKDGTTTNYKNVNEYLFSKGVDTNDVLHVDSTNQHIQLRYNTDHFSKDATTHKLESKFENAGVIKYDTSQVLKTVGIHTDPISSFPTAHKGDILFLGGNIKTNGSIQIGSFNAATNSFTVNKTVNDYLAIKGVKADHCLSIDETTDKIELLFNVNDFYID